ncbi:MAG TPA: TMEM175 family protein [Anaerolineae bacterium]|nr:TMEM175 family protein [Anaerolineae bacterium]
MSNQPQPLHWRTEGNDLTRLLALSDGLFATVLTILVLDLKLPDLSQLSQGDAQHALGDLVIRLFSYILTFVVAGVFWMAHHSDFKYIERYNRRLLWYNLMLLLFVGLLPFSTAGIGNGVSALSWSVYALNIIAAGLMLALTWGYAYMHQLTNSEMPRRIARYQGLRHLITPGVFLISIGVASLAPGPYWAPLSLLTIPVIQALLDRWVLGKDIQSAPKERGSKALLWGLAPLILLLMFVTASLLAFTMAQH